MWKDAVGGSGVDKETPVGELVGDVDKPRRGPHSCGLCLSRTRALSPQVRGADAGGRRKAAEKPA